MFRPAARPRGVVVRRVSLVTVIPRFSGGCRWDRGSRDAVVMVSSHVALDRFSVGMLEDQSGSDCGEFGFDPIMTGCVGNEGRQERSVKRGAMERVV
ncbi:hypothetical protein M0R45_007211 [Rubus argutus]|uniref:Uncharacterized protein n=1 Tax=Rubus argutus TaxID=59490 RepID=A0AAW1XX05_RUBAR